MKFFKWVGIFIFLIAAIILANMTYDYIKVCWWGSAIEKSIDDIK